jgi:hypothetical protein
MGGSMVPGDFSMSGVGASPAVASTPVASPTSNYPTDGLVFAIFGDLYTQNASGSVASMPLDDSPSTIFTQSTENRKPEDFPTYFREAGTNQYLDGVIVASKTVRTMLIAARNETYAGFYTEMVSQTTPGANAFNVGQRSDGVMYLGGSASNLFGSNAVPLNTDLLMVFVSNGAASSMKYNGITTTGSQNASGLFTDWRIGNGNNGSWSGRYYAILAWDRDLTGAEITSIKSYINTRCSITLTE